MRIHLQNKKMAFFFFEKCWQNELCFKLINQLYVVSYLMYVSLWQDGLPLTEYTTILLINWTVRVQGVVWFVRTPAWRLGFLLPPASFWILCSTLNDAKVTFWCLQLYPLTYCSASQTPVYFLFRWRKVTFLLLWKAKVKLHKLYVMTILHFKEMLLDFVVLFQYLLT